MSDNDSPKVSNWKLFFVLMLIVWMANILMSFVYKYQLNFLWYTWLTNIFLSLIETILFAILFYIFYLLFWRRRRKDKEIEDDDAQ